MPLGGDAVRRGSVPPRHWQIIHDLSLALLPTRGDIPCRTSAWRGPLSTGLPPLIGAPSGRLRLIHGGAGHGSSPAPRSSAYLETSPPRRCSAPSGRFCFLCGEVSMGDDRSL